MCYRLNFLVHLVATVHFWTTKLYYTFLTTLLQLYLPSYVCVSLTFFGPRSCNDISHCMCVLGLLFRTTLLQCYFFGPCSCYDTFLDHPVAVRCVLGLQISRMLMELLMRVTFAIVFNWKFLLTNSRHLAESYVYFAWLLT